MTNPHFDKEYEQGATAPYVDWVAGGNFDGYIQKKSIIFIEAKNQVIIKNTVIDQSRYDGNAINSEMSGVFKYTDKDTITVTFDKFEMRGKILGEYIVFSVLKPSMNIKITEVYQLK